MSIGERIKKVRMNLNMTQTEFATRIGSVQNTITGYESGRRNPSAPVIALICREFNVNEEWLRTGEGDMFLPANRRDEISKFMSQLMQEEKDSFKNRLISILADLSTEEWEFLEHRLKQLYEGKNIGSNTFPTEIHNQTTEELEAEYKKTISSSAQNTSFTASNTTDGKESKKAIG